MLARLTKEMLEILEEKRFEAIMCTATKDRMPSGRQVGIGPSEDLTKLYVGDSRFNKARRDLRENKNVMFLFYNSRENPYEVKAFQAACKLVEIIEDKDNPVFQGVYEATKEAVSKEEAEMLKYAYVFEIEQIYNCSIEGEGQVVENH